MGATRGEPVIGDIKSLRIECGDCGRERWLKQHELLRGSVSGVTPIRIVMDRLVCADCRDEGSLGRNLIAVPYFFDKRKAIQAEAWATNIRAAQPMG